MSRFGLLLSAAIVAAAGAAAAQPAPQAKCPYASADQCPKPEPATPTTPQSEIEPQPQPTYTTPTYTEPTYVDNTLERWGVMVTLGGGVSGFTGDTMRDTTDDGGEWDVRVGYGLRGIVGLEASYIGSAQSINALGLDNDAILIGNGVQGALRLNILDYNIQPFVYGGVAWRHYNLTNENFNTSDISDSDDVIEFPVGVGLAWKYKGFLLDARGEFRWATQEDMVPSLTRLDTAGMDRYGVSANVGFAF